MSSTSTTSPKVLARGSKQILEENAQTLSFYRNMIFGSAGIYFGLKILLGGSAINEDGSTGYTWTEIFFFLFAAGILVGCLQFMKFMSTPKYSKDPNTGKSILLDPGTDINMANGIGEHLKDIIILTSVLLVLSYFTHYFWLLWLLVPGKGVFWAWTNFIGPWLRGGDGADGQMDEFSGPGGSSRKEKGNKIKYRNVNGRR